MVTNRTMSAVKAGVAGGLLGGMVAASIKIGIAAALEPFAFAAVLFFGIVTGILSMKWGGGYVRTLENSVVQGGFSGAIAGIVTFIIVAVGIALTNAGPVGAVSAWAMAEQTNLMSKILMSVISGIVGAVACAPFMLRLR